MLEVHPPIAVHVARRIDLVHGGLREGMFDAGVPGNWVTQSMLPTQNENEEDGSQRILSPQFEWRIN